MRVWHHKSPQFAGVGHQAPGICRRSARPVETALLCRRSGASLSAGGSIMRERAPTGQTVVVTGASAGIGRAVARAYGARQARVALLARGDTGLAGAARDVTDAGGTALPIPVDVTDPDQVDAAAARVENEFGPIDVWVNVAFTSVFAPFVDISPAEYRRVTDVSYLGYVYGTMT